MFQINRKVSHMNSRELFEKALAARENAYTPYSGFKVGAALLTEDGKIYTGVNVENASYGAAICAERTAFVKAVSEGYRSFSAIAIAGGKDGGEMEECWPCGICRQFMYEFSPDLDVTTGSCADKLVTKKLSELLPEGFTLQNE